MRIVVNRVLVQPRLQSALPPPRTTPPVHLMVGPTNSESMYVKVWIEVQCVPLKRFGSADCDNIYLYTLSLSILLHTNSWSKPFSRHTFNLTKLNLNFIKTNDLQTIFLSVLVEQLLMICGVTLPRLFQSHSKLSKIFVKQNSQFTTQNSQNTKYCTSVCHLI